MDKTRLNSILISVALALSSWTLYNVHELSLRLSALIQKVDDGKSARTDAQEINRKDHERIFQKMDELVSRRELELQTANLRLQILGAETKLAELTVAVRSLEVRVAGVELEIKSIKRQ